METIEIIDDSRLVFEVKYDMDSSVIPQFNMFCF